MRTDGLGVGAVVQIVFPLASCSPVFTITRWGADVSLETGAGCSSTIHIDRLRRGVADGTCVVMRPAPRAQAVEPKPLRMDRPCTIEEARALAGVSRRTIYNWMDSNKVKYQRVAGGRVRIDPASLFTLGSGAA